MGSGGLQKQAQGPTKQGNPGKRRRRRGLSEWQAGVDVVIPTFDAGLARQMALLVQAGLPPDAAVGYLVPGLRGDLWEEWADRWMNTPEMLAATRALNGGDWAELPSERRAEIALDKHRAECAFYLWTHDLESADKFDFEKLTAAREVLEAFTKGAMDPSDPLAAFARAAKDIMQAAADRERPADPSVQ